MWEWCLDRRLTVQAEHVPGRENDGADRESRKEADPSDRMLHPGIFGEMWGRFDVDLFAAQHNAQLPRLFSYRLDPLAEVIDALNQTWSTLYHYASILLGRVLQKIRERSPSGSSDSANMGEPALVSTTPGECVGLSRFFFPRLRTCCQGEPQHCRGGPVVASCLDSFRASIEFSEAALSLIDRGMEKSYSSAWIVSCPATPPTHGKGTSSMGGEVGHETSAWKQWFARPKIDVFLDTIAPIVEFIAHKFKEGKQYSALNSYRSALSATIPPERVSSIHWCAEPILTTKTQVHINLGCQPCGEVPNIGRQHGAES